MKKLISILLVFCMLLGLSVVPAVAEDSTDASAETTIDYYKWDFSDEALYKHDYHTPKSYTGENGTYEYNPVTTKAQYVISQGKIDDQDALRIKVGGSRSNATSVVPLKSNGEPFELKPGSTYSVKITMKLRSTGTGTNNTSRFGIAPYTKLGDYEDDASKGGALLMTGGVKTDKAFRNALYKIEQFGQIRSNGVGGDDMGYIYDSKGAVASDTYYFNINESGKSYSYNYVVTMEDEEEMAAKSVTVNDDGSYKYATSGFSFNGFFAIALPAVYDQYYITKDGQVDPDSFKSMVIDGVNYSQIYTDCYITELEIIETACAVIELYNGDEIIDVLTGDEGADLSILDPEVPEGKSFAGWFTDKELTTPFEGDTFPGGVTKLYASFEDLETVTVTLINGEEVTTITGVPGEELNLPETGIIDTNWYTDYENYKVFTDTVFPAEDIELHTAKEYFVDGKSYLRDGMFNAVNTTDENGKEVPALLFDGTGGTSRGVYRFDKVADQVTYKLSFKYKLETTNKGFDISLLTSSYGTVYSYQMYVEGNVNENNNVIYKITTDNKIAGEWYTAEIFFTANVNGTVTQATKGDDYTVNTTGRDALFLFVKEIDNGNDKMYMKDFVVTPIENALEDGGASVLIGEAEEEAGGQAIRYYFDYKTEDGSKIKLGDNEYEVVERGVIFRNGATYKASNGIKERVPNSTVAFRDNEKLAVSSVTDNTKFGQCWEYNNYTSTMRFSYYVYGFESSDTKELMARGFITFKDNEGNQFTIYSAHINRSVAYMEMLY